MKRNDATIKCIKTIISIIIPVLIFLMISYIGAILIQNTNLPETVIPLFSVIASCVLAITMSILLVINTNVKPIYSLFISVFLIITLKCFFTLMINNHIELGTNNILNIVFTIFFSFAGTIVGVIIKK